MQSQCQTSAVALKRVGHCLSRHPEPKNVTLSQKLKYSVLSNKSRLKKNGESMLASVGRSWPGRWQGFWCCRDLTGGTWSAGPPERDSSCIWYPSNTIMIRHPFRSGNFCLDIWYLKMQLNCWTDRNFKSEINRFEWLDYGRPSTHIITTITSKKHCWFRLKLTTTYWNEFSLSKP